MRSLLLLALFTFICALASDPCALTKTCVPTNETYNFNVDTVVPPLGREHWVKCRGPYALCAYANCTVLPDTEPPLVACGCYEPSRPGWYVTPRQLKSRTLYRRTSNRCFDGDAMSNNNTMCTKVNSAPVCKAIIKNNIYNGDYDLISTFTPTRGLRQTNCTGPGVMAECMSAACYRKQAFDGSNVTCYCLLVNVPTGQQYGLGRHKNGPSVTCNQPNGFMISGEYTQPLN